MTGFDEEAIRADTSVIAAVEKCVKFEARDFGIIMDEIVARERQNHDDRATKMTKAAALTSEGGGLGPGVKEFRELLK